MAAIKTRHQMCAQEITGDLEKAVVMMVPVGIMAVIIMLHSVEDDSCHLDCFNLLDDCSLGQSFKKNK